jgi:hypothetical protein
LILFNNGSAADRWFPADIALAAPQGNTVSSRLVMPSRRHVTPDTATLPWNCFLYGRGHEETSPGETMSTTTSTIHGTQLSSSHTPQPTTADSYDMTPRARRIVSLILLAGILFLATLGAYVWYGFSQWKNIP